MRRTADAAPLDMARFASVRVESPIGPLLVAATDDGICLLEFDDSARAASEMAQLARLVPAGSTASAPARAHLASMRGELGEYFAGRRSRFETPIVYPGTAFQRRVWDALLAIPFGSTRSYEELALSIGARDGQRAVGHANGQNRIAIVIPCHRVVNKNGRLGGYGGGLWRKEFLLGLEGARPRRLIEGAA
jgi:AraC family transcriptional regulator of adaptative response/methylated-DNA-[protein]-cysteine methyltransferase